MPRKAKLFEFASTDPDALVVPIICYDGPETPIKAWEMLQELRNMWNEDEEEMYMHYVNCEWLEVYES